MGWYFKGPLPVGISLPWLVVFQGVFRSWMPPSSTKSASAAFLGQWYFLTGTIEKKTCVIIIISSFHLETSVSKTRKWKCWSLFHQVGGRVATVIGSFHRYASAIARWVGFHSHGGTPSEHWMVYFMEDPSKMDDGWGYPYFRKLPFAGHVAKLMPFFLL